MCMSIIEKDLIMKICYRYETCIKHKVLKNETKHKK